MSINYKRTATLRVQPIFYDFVENELLNHVALDVEQFWSGLASISRDLAPLNRELLAKRDELQAQIDAWHEEHDYPWDHAEYVDFLREIGYLSECANPFEIRTTGVDPEIASVAGPQLVVPVSNARFALNAANARWGSLYDALYGTDVIGEDGGRERGSSYNPARGSAVVAYSAGFLDQVLPLAQGSHSDLRAYRVYTSEGPVQLRLILDDGSETILAQPENFLGYRENGTCTGLLFTHHGLRIEIQIDPEHPIGRESRANVADVALEAAITTIQDCEDSVAAVDAEDKVAVYRNWLGLMRGTLAATFEKDGRTMTRTLNGDIEYIDLNGEKLVLPGRSLMLVRNVGHQMTSDAVLDENGDEIFEGILDAYVTSACALADTRQQSHLPNSRTGSIYIVKPKMHGPDEVAFANTLFERVEDALGLDRFTLKIGVMDEERRTSVNLDECIRQVRDRIVFINTGFLDRTGDEIHTSMRAGPVLPKEAIKSERWITAYENRNVDVGIRCGLPGKAQIGKGMWPKPDEMLEMMETKQAHPEAGANCAWVPSPTAATLHAMHYHHVDVAGRQMQLANRDEASLDDILTPPICDPSQLDSETIKTELENNTQGILGYVVRWIDQGVGCSKVPDINDVGLMEDRATLRISSQHIANWLQHGICTESQVRETLLRQAAVVDRQNAGDPAYQRMSADPEGNIAFQAACRLIFDGTILPSGCTEPVLHEYRRRKKAASRIASRKKTG